MHVKNSRKNFFCGDGQALEELAQMSYGVSVHGDTQNRNGHGPGQPVPADPSVEGLD